MKSIYSVEIRKALGNKWFAIAMIVGCLLAMLSFVGNALLCEETVERGLQTIDETYMMLSPLSCYKYWIVNDFLQPATDLFFLLLPLLSVLPYSWSYLSESKSGVIANIIVRSSRSQYFKAKYLAVFLSGGVVVATPILLNLVLCLCTMPAYMPDAYDVVYLGIYSENLWSEVFYTNPALYCLLFAALDFVFAGIWAITVAFLSFFIKNRVSLMVIPYVSILFLKFLEEKAGFDATSHPGLTPFTYLRASATSYPTNGYVVLAEAIILLALSIVVFFVGAKKDIL